MNHFLQMHGCKPPNLHELLLVCAGAVMALRLEESQKGVKDVHGGGKTTPNTHFSLLVCVMYVEL